MEALLKVDAYGAIPNEQTLDLFCAENPGRKSLVYVAGLVAISATIVVSGLFACVCYCKFRSDRCVLFIVFFMGNFHLWEFMWKVYLVHVICCQQILLGLWISWFFIKEIKPIVGELLVFIVLHVFAVNDSYGWNFSAKLWKERPNSRRLLQPWYVWCSFE